MPKIAGKYSYSEYESSYTYAQNSNSTAKLYYYRKVEKQKKLQNPKRKRNKVLGAIFALGILGLLFAAFLPYSFDKITSSVFSPNRYKNITTDLYQVAFPATNYLSNNWFMGKRFFTYPEDRNHAQMQAMKEGVNMPVLKSELLTLMEEYPTVKPAIFVWDYETQNYVDINGSKVYPTASIIKIPVLIDLFKAIEDNAVSLKDKIPLTEYYRSEGSGDLQFQAGNSLWDVDNLARLMITNSDNSATNMLMSDLGAMTGVNRSIKDWGLKNTEIQTWLPDMKGTNHSTAKEIATMLYNIDTNDEFLSDKSRNKIYDYMSHVHNDRLIQAGLGAGSTFYHKTGDIGTMLGDAGIVATPNGKRYIVVILALRPHNSVLGKDFIVRASQIIYNYMVR